MGAVVGPDTPIVVGFALRVFAVLVVQESDHLFQHRLGHRNARAKHRPGELEGEVGTKTWTFSGWRLQSMGNSSPCQDRAIPIRESWGWWRRMPWLTSSS